MRIGQVDRRALAVVLIERVPSLAARASAPTWSTPGGRAGSGAGPRRRGRVVRSRNHRKRCAQRGEMAGLCRSPVGHDRLWRSRRVGRRVAESGVCDSNPRPRRTARRCRPRRSPPPTAPSALSGPAPLLVVFGAIFVFAFSLASEKHPVGATIGLLVLVGGHRRRHLPGRLQPRRPPLDPQPLPPHRHQPGRAWRPSRPACRWWSRPSREEGRTRKFTIWAIPVSMHERRKNDRVAPRRSAPPAPTRPSRQPASATSPAAPAPPATAARDPAPGPGGDHGLRRPGRGRDARPPPRLHDVGGQGRADLGDVDLVHAGAVRA